MTYNTFDNPYSARVDYRGAAAPKKKVCLINNVHSIVVTISYPWNWLYMRYETFHSQLLFYQDIFYNISNKTKLLKIILEQSKGDCYHAWKSWNLL